jgi:acylphosphatase
MEDGSLEVAASGDEQQVELLRVELQRGPSGSRVKEVEDLEGPMQEPLAAPFEIAR